jgi:hypothetical protein
MGPERAEILGLEALAWLAGEPEGLERLFSASGLDLACLKRAAGNRELQRAVVEFLLSQEDLLVRFCAENTIPPQDMHAAAHFLENGNGPHRH